MQTPPPRACSHQSEPLWQTACLYPPQMKVSPESKRQFKTRWRFQDSRHIAPQRRATQTAAVFFLLAFLLSCGYAGRPPVTEVVVLIDPTSAVTLALGQTQQFQASIAGSTNTAVTWDVNNLTGGNASVGTISSAGLYTAPATPPNAGSVTVTAISQASPQTSASAIVTLTDTLAVSIQSGTASVPAGGAQGFTATVRNRASHLRFLRRVVRRIRHHLQRRRESRPRRATCPRRHPEFLLE
jgi:hypothetical protein